MSDLGRRIIEGLQEFKRKLKSNIPIEVTRGEICPDCRNDAELKVGCQTCHGKGFIFYTVEL